MLALCSQLFRAAWRKLRLTINMRVQRFQEPSAAEFCRKLPMIGERRAPLNDRYIVKFPPSIC